MTRRHSVRGRRSDPRPRYRPLLLELEARLPLGDGVLGLLAGAVLLPPHATPAAVQPVSESSGEPVVGRVFNPSTGPDGLEIRPAEEAFTNASQAAPAAPDWAPLTDPLTPAARRRQEMLFPSPQREQGPDVAPLPAPRAGEERVATSQMLPTHLPSADAPLLTTLAGVWPGAAPATHEVPPAQEETVRANFAKLPLSFEQNVGQTDTKVDFLTRGPGYALYLSAAEATVVLHPPDGRTGGVSPLVRDAAQDWMPHQGADAPRSPEAPPAVVRMQVLGGNAAAPASGVDRLPGVVNYFLGNDPARWHTGIATFSRVTYDDVYPGIDLVWHGSQRQLEYDFVVAPGADPSAIRLGFTGAERVEIDAAGDLVLHLGEPGGVSPGSTLRQHAPFVYQELGGTRQEVASRFMLEGAQVRFTVGAYDAGRPLVIDPVLSYSTYLGGSGSDFGFGLAVDPATGDALLTGDTFSPNFPTANPLQATYGGGADVFVARLNAGGSALVFSTYLGGSSLDQGRALAVDPASGDVLLTGYTQSTNFPTANPLQAVNRGSTDVFVARLSAAGSALVYSTYLGGSTIDQGYALAVDAATGHALVTGRTNSTNFPTANPLQAVHRGNYDLFVTRLSASGSGLVWSTYLGGGGDDIGNGLAVDAVSGDTLLTGSTRSTNFPTANPLQANNRGNGDVFVARLNASGSGLVYSTYLGGGGYEEGRGLAVDAVSGDALVTGLTESSDFPTANPLYTSNRGNSDVFVARLSAAGSALVYSTYLGGSNLDTGWAIVVDAASGDALVTGTTDSTNFPTANPLQASNRGGDDGFVARLNASGSALVFSTYLGGSANDLGRGIAVDPDTGDALVTGSSSLDDFPTANPLQAFRNGNGLYRSTDAAGNWSRLQPTGLPSLVLSAMLVDPRNPATVYALSLGRVVKSIDGGATWGPSGNGLGGRTITSLVIDPITPSTLYAGIDNSSTDVGAFKSTNGGASWVPLYSNTTHPRVSALAVDPVTPSTLYAGTLRPFGGSANYQVYKSTDGGVRWVLSSAGIPKPEGRISAMAVDPVSPLTVYAATASGVYKSTNGGGAWAVSNTGLPSAVQLLAIARPVPTSLQAPAKTSVLYAATPNRVYKSTNNGSTWTLSSTGLPNAAISALVASPADPATLYVGTLAGIYKSTNAGASWARVDAGFTHPTVTAVALAASSPATLYASAATESVDAFVARISP